MPSFNAVGRGALLPPRPNDPWAFRAPLHPWPIEPIVIPHPDVPLALDGLTVLHISDLHIRRRARGRVFRDLLNAVAQTPADLIAYTGDYHDDLGDEPAAADLLAQLAAAARPRIAQIGIFGNHDSPVMRRLARERAPAVRWLNNELTDPLRAANDAELPIRVLGLSFPEDPLAATLPHADALRTPAPTRPFILTLAHMPSVAAACADLNLSIILAGHTHGGQIRLNPRMAIHTSSDLPANMAAGMLRLRQTIVCISRGIGDGVWPDLRINCPWQLPLYTLRRGILPESDQPGATRVGAVKRW